MTQELFLIVNLHCIIFNAYKGYSIRSYLTHFTLLNHANGNVQSSRLTAIKNLFYLRCYDVNDIIKQIVRILQIKNYAISIISKCSTNNHPWI